MTSAQQTFVVLETNGHVNGLIAASEYYAQPRTIGVSKQYVEYSPQTGRSEIGVRDEDVTLEPITRLTRPRAMLIVSALIKETMGQYLRYRMPESPLAAIAAALRDCAVPTHVDYAMAEDFLCLDAVDSVVIDIHKQISTFIAENTWRQWDLFETPGLMGLIGGQDYRIAEWERYHGHEFDDEDMTLSVDIRTVVNYIREQLVKIGGEAARQIPVGPIVIDALQRRYTNVEFKEDQPVPYEAVLTILRLDYEDFYRQHIKQVIEAFLATFLLSRVDGSIPYTAEITDHMNLVFYAAKMPRNDEERYFNDLKRSIENGDWVPESERRRLFEYERSNAL